jgi:amino acid transporter
VFKLEFGYLATFSFAVSISGLFACITTTFVYPLTAGGASSAVWAWLISGAGCMCIAASVAELVSAYPTCGGLYVTTPLSLSLSFSLLSSYRRLGLDSANRACRAQVLHSVAVGAPGVGARC